MAEQDDRRIGSTVRELSDAKDTLGCLIRQADRWAEAIEDAAERLKKIQGRKWFEEGQGTTQLPEFPDHEALAQHLDKILKARSQIERLCAKLQNMGLNVA